jgi:heat shock protein HtpX
MSLTTRALVAICLMIGFYLLAISVSGGLLWLVYAQYAYFGRINRLSLAGVAGAFLILWSIMPRWDRFSPPGPRIEPSQHPTLFAVLNEIAAAMGQPMPRDIFLIPDVNAWVAQRGGLMGLASHRVMALGMPLMALLNVSQFRGVIAHEFGHYHGGDTKLGPWIYKTRSAIARTLTELERRNSWLIILFRWYGDLFLKITLSISRNQEYAADRIAAQYAGTQAMADGLKRIHCGGFAWQSYLVTEIRPVLSHGFSPPLGNGFRLFLENSEVDKAVQEDLKKELREGKSDVLDSHPSLAERIAALGFAGGSQPEDTRPATELLNDFFSVDTSLFLTNGVTLSPLGWDQVTQQVWAPSWQAQVNAQPELFQNMKVADLVHQLWSGKLRQRLKNPPGTWPTTEEREHMANMVATSALNLTLLQDGWVFHMLPGECYCIKNGKRLQPLQLMSEIAGRKMSLQQWEEICSTNAMGELSLQQEKAIAASS